MALPLINGGCYITHVAKTCESVQQLGILHRLGQSSLSFSQTIVVSCEEDGQECLVLLPKESLELLIILPFEHGNDLESLIMG